MVRRSWTAVSLLALGASAALAGPKRDVVYKLNGTQASASFQQSEPDGNFVEGSFNPTPLPDGTLGYQVSVEWCGPSFDCNYMVGLVPASAVKIQGGNVSISVTPSTFLQVSSASGNAGEFVGTFTPYAGPNSASGSSTGNSSSVEVNPDGSKTTFSFSGNQTQQMANFVGILGPETVSAPPPGGSNGFIKVSAGNMREVITAP